MYFNQLPWQCTVRSLKIKKLKYDDDKIIIGEELSETEIEVECEKYRVIFTVWGKMSGRD